MSQVSDADLARLKELLAQATPGLWRQKNGVIFAGSRRLTWGDEEEGYFLDMNAELVIALRNLIEPLLAEREAMQTVVEAARDYEFIMRGMPGTNSPGAQKLSAAFQRLREAQGEVPGPTDERRVR